MNVDKQTLADLEILRTGDQSLSLFSLVDRTITAGGNQRLTQKFLHPPGDREALSKQQEVIRFLTHHNTVLPFGNAKLKSLEDYLSSNIDMVTSGSFLECAWFWITDRQAFWYLKAWMADVEGFVTGFEGLVASLQPDPPEILKLALREIRELSEDPEFRRVLTPSAGTSNASFARVLRSDMMIRSRFRRSLKRIIDWYYELDALVSMAQATLAHHFQFPGFTGDADCLFEAEELFHPLLHHPVPCDIKLTPDGNFIFLTGPNMSGKTTFLKATGIAVFLGHLGMGIPAKGGKMVYFDRLFTSLNITDSIENGYSFFFNEVRRVKELAEALNRDERVFSLVDELFRGTNVKDAYDATVLVMQGLVPWKESAFIIATHLWETWKQIESFANVRSLCFESELREGVPFFTYRMLPGVSDMRLGLHIIENEKISSLLNRKSL